jgi:hypothetical protein
MGTDPTTVWNEQNLRKSIAGVWGEHGAHIDVADFMVREIARLRRLETAVKKACAHDRDCEHEGEGECCYLLWRAVAVLSDEARNLTEPERALLLADADRAGRHQPDQPNKGPE